MKEWERARERERERERDYRCVILHFSRDLSLKMIFGSVNSHIVTARVRRTTEGNVFT